MATTNKRTYTMFGPGSAPKMKNPLYRVTDNANPTEIQEEP